MNLKSEIEDLVEYMIVFFLIVLSHKLNTMLFFKYLILQIVRLKESVNYSSWKTSIKYILINIKLWDVIIEMKIRFSIMQRSMNIIITEMINSFYVDWINKNNKTSIIIMLNVSLKVIVVIDNMKTAKEMWNYLFLIYISHEFNLQYILFTNLYTLCLNQFELVNNYTFKYKSLLIEIAAFNFVIDEILKIIFFFINLEVFYSQWITAK